jgi:hypothetical protein
MSLRKIALDVARVISQEAENNAGFRKKLLDALQLAPSEPHPQNKDHPPENRPKNRRAPALLDPVQIAGEHGDEVLRGRLSQLSLEQLKDIVADYGMDPGKLVLKWKSPERIIDRIIEVSIARSRKGDAFRN